MDTFKRNSQEFDGCQHISVNGDIEGNKKVEAFSKVGPTMNSIEFLHGINSPLQEEEANK